MFFFCFSLINRGERGFSIVGMSVLRQEKNFFSDICARCTFFLPFHLLKFSP